MTHVVCSFIRRFCCLGLPLLLFAPYSSSGAALAPYLWEIDGTESADDAIAAADIAQELQLLRPPKLDDLNDLPALAQEPAKEEAVQEEPTAPPSPQSILINFTNVNMIEFIRFLSRISGRNFVFDEADLQFNVTIVSETPTAIDDIMTALIQELRIHDLSLMEQGNNLIIHKNPAVNSISEVRGPKELKESPESELITQVFRLNTLDPTAAVNIIRPLTSEQALIGISPDTRHLVVTDIAGNLAKMEKLLKNLDAPTSGLVVGEYRVGTAETTVLIELAQAIMEPIAAGQTLNLIAHPAAKTIFVVSSPFLVDQTLSMLSELDTKTGETKVLDLEKLKPLVRLPQAEEQALPPEALPLSTGKWELDPSGTYSFRTRLETPSGELPQGEWVLDPNGNWYFVPKGTKPPFPVDERKRGAGPKGRWVLTPDGWVYQLPPGEGVQTQEFRRKLAVEEDLPVGSLERTQFTLYKLRYRGGDEIVEALQSIATSLKETKTNTDLLDIIASIQWIETSNSLILVGTPSAIEKMEEVIEEIDVPMKQVFIEVLILETTIDDSLNFGVSWGTRSGGGNTSTAQGFISGASPLVGALSGGLNPPDANLLAQTVGFNLGVIGKAITHNGTQFSTLGALVSALHQQNETNIILNPKIIAEDNTTAEMFVGINTPFQDQAISNDEGSIITTNVEFRDVGTSLKVTPFLGTDDMITLEIEQENSSVAPQPTAEDPLSATSVGPTTRTNRTKTRFHLPDGYFLIISGMITTEEIHDFNQVPCLGGLPFIGAGFRSRQTNDNKRNLMIFIRPKLINSEEEVRQITRQQERIYHIRSRPKEPWRYEVEGAFDFLNLPTECESCCGCD